MRAVPAGDDRSKAFLTGARSILSLVGCGDLTKTGFPGASDRLTIAVSGTIK